jgi:hypothetical protein
MLIKRSFASRAAFGATLVVGLFSATAAMKAAPYGAAMFGGPWISIEAPVNPYYSSGTGALFLVHTYVHQTLVDLPVAGRAEGIVDGKRRSVPFTLARSAQTGTYVVRPEWGRKGIWTVLVTAMPEAKNGWRIQAAVNVGADGEIEHVSVPHAGHVLTEADVERGLQDRAKAMLAVSAR